MRAFVCDPLLAWAIVNLDKRVLNRGNAPKIPRGTLLAIYSSDPPRSWPDGRGALISIKGFCERAARAGWQTATCVSDRSDPTWRLFSKGQREVTFFASLVPVRSVVGLIRLTNSSIGTQGVDWTTPAAHHWHFELVKSVEKPIAVIRKGGSKMWELSPEEDEKIRETLMPGLRVIEGGAR